MLAEEELKQIAQVMAEQLKPINERLDKVDERLDVIEEKLDIIEESLEETRGTTNAISEWVETNFKHKYPYPIDKDIV